MRARTFADAFKLRFRAFFKKVPCMSDHIPVNVEGSASKPDYSLGTLCHLLSLVLFVGIPVGNVLAPLVLWLLKRQYDSYLDATGKEVLNFQISITIYALICGILILLGIGIILLPILFIMSIVCTIIGAIKSSEGIIYRYPLTIRFLK